MLGSSSIYKTPPNRSRSGSQTNPLGLLPKSACRAGQGQIVKPHVHKKTKAGIKLLQNLTGNQGILPGEFLSS